MTSPVYEFALLSNDPANAGADLQAVGIHGVRIRASGLRGYGTEAQIRRLAAMGYDVDCWELNDKLRGAS
jgi:hypothetical protein